jgi:hypothetical protein
MISTSCMIIIKPDGPRVCRPGVLPQLRTLRDNLEMEVDRDWLLEGDPAVRWRLLDGAESDRERARIGVDGWGARLLAEQDADGSWGGGPYSPKWISTTYTLLHLLWLGLMPDNPAARRGLATLWNWQSGWRAGSDTCIESMVIRLSSYFGDHHDRLDALVQRLLAQQLPDGGWNCAAERHRSTHGSFHTSIQTLEALATYARTSGVIDTEPAEVLGRDFFLRHRLFRSHRTGEVAIKQSVRFPAFPEWHFDVLRGLEYFAAVDADRDDRLRDAVEVVQHARRRDGRWPTYAQYSGKQWFQLEPSGPSRWNTMRASLVLDWWNR